MNSRTPLGAACALTNGQAGGRRARWQAVLADGGARTEAVDGGVRVRLDARPGIRERLEALVAAERNCCAFADWTVEAGAEGLRLDVRVPGGDPALVEGIREEFRLPPPPGPTPGANR